MTQPSKTNDSGYKRLLLFPLAMFYIATLVVSSWPTQLSPSQLAPVQLAANHVLAQLAVLPAVSVFTGRTTDRRATLNTCFRISGYTRDRTRVVLFDSFDKCRDQVRHASKPVRAQFHDKSLRSAIEHLARPGAVLDRNRAPLDALFSLGDYYCHHADVALTHVIVTSRYQRRHLDSGERSDETTVEGAHHCAEGAWEIIRARKPDPKATTRTEADG